MIRKNTVKLLDMITNGDVSEVPLLHNLLNFLSDDEVGEFMEQYGYVEEEDDDISPEGLVNE